MIRAVHHKVTARILQLMNLNFIQRRRILKATNSLDLIPVRVSSFETSEKGLVTLLIPKFKNEKFANWFIPKSRSLVYKVNLDEIGSAFWLEADGFKNVNEITNTLVEKFNERIKQEAEKRMVKFLSGLYENRYITFKQIQNKRN